MLIELLDVSFISDALRLSGPGTDIENKFRSQTCTWYLVFGLNFRQTKRKVGLAKGRGWQETYLC